MHEECLDSHTYCHTPREQTPGADAFSTTMPDADAFSEVLHGVCVVESGDVLHGHPRRVKVWGLWADVPGSMQYFRCCWPRGPRFDEVTKFYFIKRQKTESTLQQQHTSLEAEMAMMGMAFRRKRGRPARRQ